MIEETYTKIALFAWTNPKAFYEDNKNINIHMMFNEKLVIF